MSSAREAYVRAILSTAPTLSDYGNCYDSEVEMVPEDDKAIVAVDLAKEVCEGCPVVDECLDWALEHPDLEGVWGGRSVKERKVLARQRGIG